MTKNIDRTDADTSSLASKSMKVLREVLPLATFAACAFAAYIFVYGDIIGAK